MVWIWHLSRTEVWIKYILPLLFKDIIFLSPLEVRYSFLSVLFSFMLSFGIVYNKCQQKGNQYIIKKNHIWGLKESKEEIKKLDKQLQWTEPKLSLWEGENDDATWPEIQMMLRPFECFSGVGLRTCGSELHVYSNHGFRQSLPFCTVFWQIFTVLFPLDEYWEEFSFQAKGFETILKQSFLYEIL